MKSIKTNEAASTQSAFVVGNTVLFVSASNGPKRFKCMMHPKHYFAQSNHRISWTFKEQNDFPGP